MLHVVPNAPFCEGRRLDAPLLQYILQQHLAAPELQPEAGAEPTVSVVIPVRNHGKLVCQTLDSILTQEWPHLEVIVVDDGSTDDTAAVVSSTYRDRVKLLVLPDAGPPLRATPAWPAPPASC